MKAIKKALCFLIILATLSMTGCVVNRDKAVLRELYSDDSNYVTLKGVVVKLSKEYTQLNGRYCYLFWVGVERYDCDEVYQYSFGSSTDFQLTLHDEIEYMTINTEYKSYNNRIVQIVKDGATLLEFEDGKTFVFEWIDQIRYK